MQERELTGREIEKKTDILNRCSHSSEEEVKQFLESAGLKHTEYASLVAYLETLKDELIKTEDKTLEGGRLLEIQNAIDLINLVYTSSLADIDGYANQL